MHKAQFIYESVIKGTEISDEDLSFGVQYFTDLAAKLISLGPVFRLASDEVAKTLRVLVQYKRARAEDSAEMHRVRPTKSEVMTFGGSGHVTKI